MRTVRKSNFRLEVYPQPRVLGFGTAADEEICKKMEEQIRRHVDYVSNIYLIHDAELICEWCGKPWTEDSDYYNRGCCKVDQEAEKARFAKFGEEMME